MSAVAYKMDDCYDIVFTVSAVKSMRIVRVGCRDSEAVCTVWSSLYKKGCIHQHCSLFLGKNIAHLGFSQWSFPSGRAFDWCKGRRECTGCE